MTQIHPKDTFLNGDVMISNKGQKSATIADSITGESFTLTPGKFRAQLKCLHIFVIKSAIDYEKSNQ